MTKRKWIKCCRDRACPEVSFEEPATIVIKDDDGNTIRLSFEQFVGVSATIRKELLSRIQEIKKQDDEVADAKLVKALLGFSS